MVPHLRGIQSAFGLDRAAPGSTDAAYANLGHVFDQLRRLDEGDSGVNLGGFADAARAAKRSASVVYPRSQLPFVFQRPYTTPPTIEIRVVLPTSQTRAEMWRHVTQKPADGWTAPDFDVGVHHRIEIASPIVSDDGIVRVVRRQLDVGRVDRMGRLFGPSLAAA